MRSPRPATVLTPPLRRRAPLAHAAGAIGAIVGRELQRFVQQRGRLVSALVRPLLWLAVFAAGFRHDLGAQPTAPYGDAVPYDTYVLPGLMGMVMLFNGMQSSLALVYDREMGLMRLLLTAPLPRPLLLGARLLAAAVLSLVQVAAFLAVAAAMGTTLPWHPLAALGGLMALLVSALMLAALGLLLSVTVRQLENFAGAMNFVIFPLYFLSTALYPLWKLQSSGAQWVSSVAELNPFTHAVEWMRFAFHGQSAGASPWIVLGTLVVCFALACWAYDPQRGLGRAGGRGLAG